MSGTSHTEAAPALTVYYDGDCPLCRREIGFYQNCRGADDVAFVNVAGSAHDPAPDLDRNTAMSRFHVRDADGKLISGAAGFAALWRVLPAWAAPGSLASKPVITNMLEWAYKRFLRIRPFIAARLK